MLYGPMTHPQFLRALAAAGHGSKILLADANYPHTTGVNPRCELISLNLPRVCWTSARFSMFLSARSRSSAPRS